MKLNPKECTLREALGKFLGYLSILWSIEANLDQIYAILNMKSPTCIKEVHLLNGRLAALNMFLSRSADKCKSFFQTLKKNRVDFRWDEKCQAAFQGLKKYLTSPLLSSKLITGETLFLYLSISESAIRGALVRDDESIQKSVYYISKSLTVARTCIIG